MIALEGGDLRRERLARRSMTASPDHMHIKSVAYILPFRKSEVRDYATERLTALHHNKRIERCPNVAACCLVLFFLLGCASPAHADIIYSGLKNISLQGTKPLQTLSINVAGGAGSWDRLTLWMSTIGLGGGSNAIVATSEVALGSTWAIFPRVARYNFGDPFPSDVMYGSGSEILWGHGFGPADGDFYTPMFLGSFGGGPKYVGWIHLQVVDSDTAMPTLTVVDWAYSDVLWRRIAMGQAGPTPAPEPSSLSLLLFAGIGLMTKYVLGRLRAPTPNERHVPQ